eukprot:282025-Amphidinium_carterae.1
MKSNRTGPARLAIRSFKHYCGKNWQDRSARPIYLWYFFRAKATRRCKPIVLLLAEGTPPTDRLGLPPLLAPCPDALLGFCP